MKMQVNPLLKKEIKLGARTVKFPIAVSIYALVLTLVSLGRVYLLTNANYSPDNYHIVDYQELSNGFVTLAYTQIFIIAFIVPLLTASSIAGEREKQTLDILLTAPVSRSSIIRGKLWAAMANIFIFIIATIPAMSVCFLYGGIEWTNLLLFIGASMIIAFFEGAIGVFCSTVFKKTVASVIITLIISGVMYLLPVILLAVVVITKEANSPSATSFAMGLWPVIMIFSPAAGYYDIIALSNSDRTLLDTIFSVSYKTPTMVDEIKPYMPDLSMVFAVVVGILFIIWASRVLDAPRRKGKKLNGIPNQENNQQVKSVDIS